MFSNKFIYFKTVTDGSNQIDVSSQSPLRDSARERGQIRREFFALYFARFKKKKKKVF